MASVWRDVLDVPHVGRHDKFFDLAGHSLLAMKAIVRLEEQTGHDIEPRDLFLLTLEELAAKLTGDDADTSTLVPRRPRPSDTGVVCAGTSLVPGADGSRQSGLQLSAGVPGRRSARPLCARGGDAGRLPASTRRCARPSGRSTGDCVRSSRRNPSRCWRSWTSARRRPVPIGRARSAGIFGTKPLVRSAWSTGRSGESACYGSRPTTMCCS